MKKIFIPVLLLVAGFTLAGCTTGGEANISGIIKDAQVVCHQKNDGVQGSAVTFGSFTSFRADGGLMPVDDCKTIMKLEVTDFEATTKDTEKVQYIYDPVATQSSVIVKSDDKKVVLKNLEDEVSLHCTWDTSEKYGEWDNCRLIK